MKLFCNWLERWNRIAELVEEHQVLAHKPLKHWYALKQIEQEIGALVVTALGKHGNSPRMR